jgi:hypothetical protein
MWDRDQSLPRVGIPDRSCLFFFFLACEFIFYTHLPTEVFPNIRQIWRGRERGGKVLEKECSYFGSKRKMIAQVSLTEGEGLKERGEYGFL